MNLLQLQFSCLKQPEVQSICWGMMLLGHTTQVLPHPLKALLPWQE